MTMRDTQGEGKQHSHRVPRSWPPCSLRHVTPAAGPGSTILPGATDARGSQQGGWQQSPLPEDTPVAEVDGSPLQVFCQTHAEWVLPPNLPSFPSDDAVTGLALRQARC